MSKLELNVPYLKTVNLGYKYRLYPTIEQQTILNHQMFIYNQSYNICLNLWKEEQEKNRTLPKEKQTHKKLKEIDQEVKDILKAKKLEFKTVVTQQARINFQKAVNRAFSEEVVSERKKAITKALTPKEKAKAINLGFPKFKSSKDINQSFNWNNQGYTILEHDNDRFEILRLIRENIKIRYHRDLPKNYKMCSITISKDATGYFVSFGIEFEKEIDLVVTSENLDRTKSIGIDLNVNNFAISKPLNEEQLLDNGSLDRRAISFGKVIKTLQRKQSRRDSKSRKLKVKRGKNYQKTQRRINRLKKQQSNKKSDLYHKISKTLTDKFESIAVEDLKIKNMSKSSKGNEINHGKNIKQKSGLNRSILSASFYQFVAMLQYKQTMLNEKLFVKVNPQYTSQICNRCGYKDKNNRKTQSKFKCLKCHHEINADINASENIEQRGLESLGLGISLQDYKSESLSNSDSLESAS
ncbi:putative virulence protein [hydrothermal vent metagenome]|uniref:Putative virulence protein n=1 Tax=hydrothermal vent metagenome TaxID=652676 RepID=A0A1W1BLE4_9ZZZZ